MTTLRSAAGLLAGISVLAVAVVGCSKTDGTPTAAGDTTAETAETSVTTAPTTTTPAATPTGEPVGTAIMAVLGGDGPVTIRYRINGGPEQTEANVTLPWEKEYPVYDKLETAVTADGGNAELTCTITMDGDKLVAFKTEARPTCEFAYWG